MAKKPKLTANQLAFKKQLRRLKQAIRRGEKAGLIFEENILPTMPKRVTKKALERISEIKPKDLREHSQYLNPETGELVPYKVHYEAIKEQRKREREEKKASKKLTVEHPKDFKQPTESLTFQTLDVSRETSEKKVQPTNAPIVYDKMSSHIVDEFLKYLSRMPSELGDPISNFIRNLSHNTSVENIAEALSKISESLWDVFERMNYEYDETVNEYTALIVNYLPFDSLEGITEEELLENKEYWYEQFDKYSVGE